MRDHDFPPGTPVWIELFTADPDAAAPFYESLLGWRQMTAGEEFGGYRNFLLDGEMVAGCMHNASAGAVPSVWFVYLASPDAAATVERARTAGSHVEVEPHAVADLGTMAVFSDAGGAMLGAWQPGTHRGIGVLSEPGAPCWFELHTREFDASLAFYRDVVDWDVHVLPEMPGFRYATFGEGDGSRAGIYDAAADLPDGVPSHWQVYFEVTDVDAAAAQVVALGGSQLEAPVDSPYGRMGTFADPTGAAFRLMESPA